jgi:hypothetical protein
MTNADQERLLTVIVEAVLHCPQLRMTQTLGQRVNAAKQIRAAVARKLSEQRETVPSGG